MPFKSDKQRRWMYANRPDIAERWSAEYKQEGGLLDGLQRPEINNLEDLQRVANARNQELAAVAAELGISPQDLADVKGSSADQANDIARQIWGDNAPQLRQSQSASETAGEMAGVLAELARQNPSWGGGQAANNQVQPAKPQGFLSWAAEQAGDAWDAGTDAAGNAFQDTIDYATGATAQREANEAYNQKLENMTAEELVEHLNQKYPTGATNAAPTVDTTVQPAQRSFWQKAKDIGSAAVDAVNPISDANAMDARSAIGLAGVIPNPTLANAPVFQGGLNVGGLMGINAANASTPGGSGGQGYSQDERIRQSWSGATSDDPRQTWKKGWFSDGWETETPQDIRSRQVENMQAFEQHTGFNMPHEQETFLHQRFGDEAMRDEPNDWQEENRDYWGGGWQEFGSPIEEREVTYDDGSKANAATAQGDWEIQAILNNPSIGLNESAVNDVWADDNNNDSGYHQEAYSGWDDGEDDSDWEDDGGWDYDDSEEAIGFSEPEPSGGGGGDDSGGGGGGK